MRKQYHFRHSKKGLLAWDIDRLIALSKEFPIIEIPLAEIKELDEEYWSKDGSKLTCRKIAEHVQLIQEVDTYFPIILFSDGEVADGMHRVCRLLLDGAPTVKAVRFTIDPEPDYVGVAPDDLPY